VSAKSRPPIPRGAPRTALPQLQNILNRQNRTPTWLLREMGQSRQTWHNNRDAGGWPDVDVPRVAALLGVTVDQLTARGLENVDASPTVRALLAQPELAKLADEATDAVRQQMADAVTRAVTETVRLLSAGSVPMPAPSAERVRRLQVLKDAASAPADPRRRSRR
jgi:hypothetical protein